MLGTFSRLGFGVEQGGAYRGITNMLMALYMSLATILFDKIHAVLFVQISGIGFMLACAYLNMRIAGQLFAQHEPSCAFYSCCSPLLYPWLIIH